MHILTNLVLLKYEKINNEIYDSPGDIWWQANSALYLLKTSVNPCRLGYFKKILNSHNITPTGKSVLDIGCGGGILSEELCKMGFETTGIDPSEQSLAVAIHHAKSQNLNIKYDKGFGEKLPYTDNSFDYVVCCDVLEHVSDLPKVISEISKVLKPKGIFFYDTINRTLFSKLSTIKIAQDWKYFALMPPNLHVWKLFIKPKELIALLEQNQFIHQHQQGTSPDINPIKLLYYLRKRVKGQLTYAKLGEKFKLVESKNMGALYMGYATKNF